MTYLQDVQDVRDVQDVTAQLLPAAGASVIVWRPTDKAEDGQLMIGGVAEGDLFDAVGLRILEGRGFTEADRHVRPQVAVVNETAAKALNGPAVESILRVAPLTGDFQSSTEVRIVGVMEAAIEPRLEAGRASCSKDLSSVTNPTGTRALALRSHDRDLRDVGPADICQMSGNAPELS